MNSSYINKLQTLPYFTKNTLRIITSEPNNTLDVSIRRMISSGQLIKFKNGLYTSEYFFNRNKHLAEYQEFISTILNQPSYLSLEYVLGKHDMLTEGVMAFTAISLKTTRSYENKMGSFIYKSISEELFLGFETKVFANNSYYIASKAKALFDYLYFLVNAVNLNPDEYDVVKERRLRLDLMNNNDWIEFFGYLDIKKSKKMNLIKELVKPHAPNL